MQAVVVYGPMDFGVEAVPVPQTPEGGMLVRVTACGLCGSDLRTLRTGHHGVEFPWVIGHEIAGEVVETGRHYKGQWAIGDHLAIGPPAYCGVCDFCVDGLYELCENHREIGQDWRGGFAEYVAVPEPCVRLGAIRRKPETLPAPFAAVSEPISSCISAHEKACTGLGDTVAIIGAGPIGCVHASLARARGAARIFLIDIAAERLRLSEPFRPDVTIDASETDPVQAVRELSDEQGADVIVTATPAPVAPVQAVDMARKGGRILVFGGLPKDDSTVPVDMNAIHYRGLHVIGITTFAPRHQRLALQFMNSERLPMQSLVTDQYPLSDFEEGVQKALAGEALKVVFLPGASGA